MISARRTIVAASDSDFRSRFTTAPVRSNVKPYVRGGGGGEVNARWMRSTRVRWYARRRRNRMEREEEEQAGNRSAGNAQYRCPLDH